MARKTRKFKKMSAHISWREVLRGVWQGIRWLLRSLLLLRYLNPLSAARRHYHSAMIIDREDNVLYRPPLTQTLKNLFTSERWRRRRLVSWAQEQVPTLTITDLIHTWTDGITLCALLEAVAPGTCPRYDLLKVQNKINNCRLGLKLANKALDIPMTLITPEEMALPLDQDDTETKMMQLLVLIRHKSAERQHRPVDPDQTSVLSKESVMSRTTEPCTVKGTGLVVGVMGKMSRFNVYFTTKESLCLMVRISDPDGEICNEKIIEANPNRRLSFIGHTSKIWTLGNKSIRLWRQSNGVASNGGGFGGAHGHRDHRKIPFDYQCLSEGHLLITFIPRISGRHEVDIRWHDRQVRGSPYSVKVVASIDQLSRSPNSDKSADSSETTDKRQGRISPNTDRIRPVEPPVEASGADSIGDVEKSRHSSRVKLSSLAKQATITRRRVLRRIMTKAGQEIVIHETPSPRESPFNYNKRDIPQRFGSPSPKPLPPNSGMEMNEPTSTQAVDRGTNQSENHGGNPPDYNSNPKVLQNKTKAMAAAMVTHIMAGVFNTIQLQHRRTQETDNNPKQEIQSELYRETCPEPLLPQKFGGPGVSNPGNSDSVRKPIAIRAQHISTSNITDEIGKEENTRSLGSCHQRKPISSDYQIQRTPVSSFLTVPMNENMFKGSPYSLAISPLSRSHLDEESESYTSESESHTSKDGRDSRAKRGSDPTWMLSSSEVSRGKTEYNEEITIGHGKFSSFSKPVEEINENNLTLTSGRNSTESNQMHVIPYQTYSDRQHKGNAIYGITKYDSTKEAHNEQDTNIDDIDSDVGTPNFITDTNTPNAAGNHLIYSKESIKKTMSDPTKRKKKMHPTQRSKSISDMDTSDSSDSLNENSLNEEITVQKDTPLKCIKSESLKKSCYFISQRAIESSVSLQSQVSVDHALSNLTTHHRQPAFQRSSSTSQVGKRKLALTSSLPTLSRNWCAFEYDPGDEPTDGDLRISEPNPNPKRATLGPTDILSSLKEFQQSKVTDVTGRKRVDQSADEFANHGETCNSGQTPNTLGSVNQPVVHLATERNRVSQHNSHISLIDSNNTLVSTRDSLKLGPYLYGSPPPPPFQPIDNDQQNLAISTHMPGVNIGSLPTYSPIKVDQATQVTYSEIKLETKWRNHLSPNAETRHRRRPCKYINGARCKSNGTHKESEPIPLVASSSYKNAYVTNNGDIKGIDGNYTPYLQNGLTRQLTLDTADSGIQEDRVTSISQKSPVPVTLQSPKAIASTPRPRTKHVNGHRLLARRMNRRIVPIDKKLLKKSSSSSVENITKKTGGDLTISNLAKTVTGVNKFRKQAKSNEKSRKRLSSVGCQRRRVTFSRKIMIYRRSSSRSTRSSKNVSATDSRQHTDISNSTQQQILPESQPSERAPSQSSLDAFLAATSDVPHNRRSYDVAHWISQVKSRTDDTGSSSLEETQLDVVVDLQSKCPSCRFREGLQSNAETSSFSALLAPKTDCVCTERNKIPDNSHDVTMNQNNKLCPVNPTLLTIIPGIDKSGQSIQSSTESDYSGFGVSSVRRQSLLSEVQAFGDIINDNTKTSLHAHGDLEEDPPVDNMVTPQHADIISATQVNYVKDNKVHHPLLDNKDTTSSSDSEIAHLTGILSPNNTESTLADISSFLFDEDIDLLPDTSDSGQDGPMSDWLQYLMQMPHCESPGSSEQANTLDAIQESAREDGSSSTDKEHHSELDASKVLAYGAGLLDGIVGHKNNFQVATDDAGPGSLSVSIQGPRPYSVLETDVTYTEDNLYEVIYDVQHPGTYTIHIRWSDMDVAGSPFTCQVTY